MIAVLVGLLVVTGGGLLMLVASDDEASAEEVRREPISTAGDNPFTPSVGTDQEDVTPPSGRGGTATGDDAGLYGGTRDSGSCDAEKLVTFLEENPDKAAAWADVLGIQTSEIRAYVDTLTPVILVSDTYVTNHGFANGRATSFAAVLQAGTAVFVDDKGYPRVKCFCGNPLTAPPSNTKVRYRGPSWPTFETTNVTVIQETTVIIDIFVLVDPSTGEEFGRPAGTGGDDDGPPPERAPPEGPEETAEPQSNVPESATYNISIGPIGGGCEPFTFTGTATLADGQLTMHFEEPFSGPVAEDGTFTIDVSEGANTLHIEGRLDAETLTSNATDSGGGITCTYTINGTAA